jgi:prepilin-type processing-associated H-X9-DG protein
MRSKTYVGLNDVLAGVLLTVLITAMAIIQARAARQAAGKAQCAANLREIGRAISHYLSTNNNRMPRTVAEETDDPRPVWGTPYQDDQDLGAQDLGPLAGDANPFGDGKTAPAANDVTASFYLVLSVEGLSPGEMLCPSTKATCWDFGGGRMCALNWTNWKGSEGITRHLSYSYQNPFPSRAAIANGWVAPNPDPAFAVASDMNPGGEAVTSVKPNSPAENIRKANSANHDHQGQNVLFGDGHVEWTTTPFCGMQHDNIFTAGGPEIEESGRKTATVIASPVSNTDSILLPTVADMDAVFLTPEEIEKLKKDLPGQYTAKMHGYTAVLTIDGKTIQWTTGPLTVKYDYEITGTSGRGLKLKLTAPDTTRKAVVTLVHNDLHLAMTGEFSLDFSWHRVEQPK